MQALNHVINVLSDFKAGNPGADKAQLTAQYVAAFNPTKARSVFIGDGYALRFSQAKGEGFSNTVLSLSALAAHDASPFVVVVVRSDRLDFLLSNTTMLKKISHSSRDLRDDNVRGSFNGSDIVTEYEGIANNPRNFEDLFAMHSTFTWSENITRLVEATNAIAPRSVRFVPSEAELENIYTAPDRASRALSSAPFLALEAELSARIDAERRAILAASSLDNVNLRGEAIERLITPAGAGHDLGDLERQADGMRIVIDIKSKLLNRGSAPKAYNVDKALRLLSAPDTVLAMLIVTIDQEKSLVGSRLVPIFEQSLLRTTTIQHHWAGRSSRGVTQLFGDYHAATRTDYKPEVNIDESVGFLRRLIAL